MSTPRFPSPVEPLEARIAPAVLIGTSGKTATFIDVDGDLATITVSAGTLTAGNFTTFAMGLGDQLQLIDFSGGGFNGVNLTITAKKTATGDGSVNVGAIDSGAYDLRMVKIKGDLGRIVAGDAVSTTPGIKQLAVDSFGRLGIDTQAAGGTLESKIEGDLSTLSVKGDIGRRFPLRGRHCRQCKNRRFADRRRIRAVRENRRQRHRVRLTAGRSHLRIGRDLTWEENYWLCEESKKFLFPVADTPGDVGGDEERRRGT